MSAGLTLLSGVVATHCVQFSHVPISPRKAFDHAEGSSNGKTGAALTSGVLRGAAAQLPEVEAGASGRTGRPATVVFVDAAHPSRRYRDAYSLETLHKRTLENVEGSGSSNSRVFHSTFGAPHNFVSRGVQHRAITPIQSSNQRHSALEQTLAGLSLWAGTDPKTGRPRSKSPGSYSKAAAGTTSGVSALTINQFGETVGTQIGTARFDGTATAAGLSASMRRPATTNQLQQSGGLAGHVMTQTLSGGRVSDDLRATKELSWVPQSVHPVAATAQIDHAARTGALFEIPAATPLLQPRADNATFLSRSSRTGVNSRGYSSNLDRTLSVLINTRAEVAGIASSEQQYQGQQRRALTASTTGDGSYNDDSDALSATRDQASDINDLYSPVAVNTSGSNSPQAAQRNESSTSPSAAARNGTARSGLRSTGPSRSAAATSESSDVDPGPRHIGGSSWTTRQSYSLVKMAGGSDMIRAGALQARMTYRLGPSHDVDLTHGFVDRGTWNTMNLEGNTRSPVRRSLQPEPTPMITAAPGAPGAPSSVASSGNEATVQDEYNGFPSSARSSQAQSPLAATARSTTHTAPESYQHSHRGTVSQYSWVAGPHQPRSPHPAQQALHPQNTVSINGANGCQLLQQQQQAPQSPGFDPRSSSQNQFGDGDVAGGFSTSLDTGRFHQDGRTPVEAQPTALGKLLSQRMDGSVAASQQASGGRPGAILLQRRSDFSAELKELDAFDAAHDMGNPSHWPKKVIRSKILSSGVADLVGFASPEKLEKSDKTALLAAYERIPSTRRLQAAYGHARAAGHAELEQQRQEQQSRAGSRPASGGVIATGSGKSTAPESRPPSSGANTRPASRQSQSQAAHRPSGYGRPASGAADGLGSMGSSIPGSLGFLEGGSTSSSLSLHTAAAAVPTNVFLGLTKEQTPLEAQRGGVSSFRR